MYIREKKPDMIGIMLHGGEAGWSLNNSCGKTYTLSETWAHPGYRGKQVSLTFMVDNNCNIIPLSDVGIDRIEFGNYPDPDMTVYVSNKPECSATVRLHKRNARTGRALDNAVFDLVHEQGNRSDTTGSSGEIVWQLDEPCSEYMVSETRAPYGYRFRNATAMISTSEQCLLSVTDTTGIDSFRIVGGSELHLYVGNMPYNVNPFHPKADSIENAVMGPRPQQPSGFYSCMHECDCDDGYPYDLRTDARLGFLRSSKEKLRRIMVFYKDSLVRSYSFCYGSDIFGRAQLRSIRQYGADCDEEPYTHTFSYYEETDMVRLKNESHAVNNAERGDNDVNASMISRVVRIVVRSTRDMVSAETAIGGSLNLSASAGGGADIGMGVDACTKENSIGYSGSYSSSSGKGLATLADINGDGLPDRVYLRKRQVCYKLQIAGANSFGTEQKLGVSSFLSDNSTTSHHGPAANIGPAHGGIGWNSTTSRTSAYFTDVNGDGMMDLVRDGMARSIQPAHAPYGISCQNGCGLPSVTPGRDSAAHISLENVPSVALSGHSDMPSYDLVRVWTAGYSIAEGGYSITAPVKVLKDTIAGVIPTRDTIEVYVEFYGRLYGTGSRTLNFTVASCRLLPGDSAWAGNLLARTSELTDTAKKYVRNGLMGIDNGGLLFFRVRSKGGRPVSHVVEWDPQVVRSGSFNSADGLPAPNAGKASACQLLESSGKLHCPFEGVLRLRDTLHPTAMRDTVRYRMRRNNSDFRHYPYTYRPGLDSTRLVDDTLHVHRNDSLEFTVEVRSNVDLAANQWHPHLYYLNVTDSNTNGEVDNVSMIIPGTPDNTTDSVLLMELHPVPKYDYYRQYLDCSPNCNPMVTAGIHNVSFNINGTVIQDSLRLVAKTADGVLSARTYYHNSYKDDLGNYPFAIWNIARDTMVYMECYVGRETRQAYVGANIKNAPCAVFSCCAEPPHPLFGGMYGGWGQFQYLNDGQDKIDTTVINAFADSVAAFSQATLDRYAFLNDTNFLKRVSEPGSTQAADTLAAILGRFRCLPLTANGETRRYEGADPNSYICGKRICLGNVVTPEPAVTEKDSLFQLPGTYVGNGTVAGSTLCAGSTSSPASAMVFSDLDRISESSSTGYTCGALMFGGSYSNGGTETTNDLTDLNGDGCPDFIRPGGQVYYSLPRLSRWETEAKPALPSDGPHTSSNRTVGGNFTAQVAQTVKKSSNRGDGQNVIINRSVSKNTKAGVNANTSTDKVEHALVDINGDGLPDLVYRNGFVRLGTGYGFTSPWKWNGIEHIGIYLSEAGGNEASKGTNKESWEALEGEKSAKDAINNKGSLKSAWKASISGGVSYALSLNQHQVTLTDMNGDGLPDLVYKSYKDTAITGFCGRLLGGHIWYRLNNGSGFDTTWIRWSTHGENQVWGTSATVGANIDGTGGMAFPLVKFSGSANANASLTTSGERIQIADFDGDGLPDLLKSKNGRDLDVRYAHLGRTGLLKTVTNPLGGSVTMDYGLTEASVYHSRRWVMTKVMTHDSLPGDGCDMQRTHIGYAHGWYDRTERDFFGFAVVVVNAVDDNNDTLRTTIQYYDNRSFYAKGSPLCEALVKISETDGITDTTKYIITTYSYDTSHIPFVVAGNTYRSVFPKLTRRQTCFFEGLPQAQVTAWEEYDYENTFGNVTKRRQGSTDQPAVEANISYHAQYNNNRCVNKIASVEITGYRKRTTEVDNKGHYTAFRDWYDNTHHLSTALQYDQYGNVTTMRGPNTTVHYTYDNYVHTYPTSITDTFGVTSQMQNYDFRFGVPRTIIDQAESRMEYTLDEWGRTKTIKGPKEMASGADYTIRYTYAGREAAPTGSTRQRAVSMAMTENYDPEHPQNPIKTYTYCDGLGRIVQTRKEAEIGGVEKLVVSGHTVVDALGRTVETYYPTEKSLTDVLFAFDPDQSAPASTMTYDILDRPLVQTAPDASTTTFSYGFAYNNDLNKMLFSSSTTDANSHVSTELKDVEGKPWAVQAAGRQFVYFNYNPVGDNTKVYSAVANDWERNYTYDMLGRRLTYQEGELVESLTYNGGNLSAHSQSWLENGTAQTKTTTYHYNAHRLDSVSYEDALTTIYHYDQYGRVDSLYDESGVVCYTYGNMGEIIKETRIYALPFLSQPIALKTEFRYDSWGRVDSIYYPDGERLNYQYDLGGQLKSITNNSNYTYLDNVTYDRFGAKVSQEYGNGLVTSYTYDSYTRRLSQITVADNSNNPYGDIQYGYDPVGNVTQANSTCPWLQNSGCNETFTYDASDQLVAAVEQGGGYSLAVTYGSWGKVNTYDLTQTDRLQNISTQNAYTFTYPTDPNNPQQAQTMFAPAAQLGGTGGMQAVTAQYTFGINGSLRKKEHLTHNNPVEYYLFNSAANLKAYSNNGIDFAYYGYNAANTRTYKLNFLNANSWVNGQQLPIHPQSIQAMFYPNAYLNFNQNGEYTKHYYNGSERIASRLGNTALSISMEMTDRLQERVGKLETRFQDDIRELVYTNVQVETPPISATSLQQTGTPTDIFYYHTNHLGSTAFVTDQNQNVTQGFLYAPFGEITTEYNANFGNNVLPKYSFNAKELDEETGMYYYEARYYKPPVFTSRDPMFEKYFWMTPYAYCANNPVKYVDPDGEEMDDFAKVPTRYRNTKGELLFETQDGLDVDIIVTNGNIPALEKALQIAKDNGTLGDAETNKITMHVLGCTPQEYSEQATKGMDDYWSSGYRATYEKAYTEGASHLSFSEFFYSFAATIGEYSGENNLQKLYGGRSVGIEEGNSDRKAGRINRLNPQSSFKNNPPIIKLKTQKQCDKCILF